MKTPQPVVNSEFGSFFRICSGPGSGYLLTYLFECHLFILISQLGSIHNSLRIFKKMISFKNFHLSEMFIKIDSIMYQSGKDLNLEKWADPYDSDLLKFVTVLIYFVNVLASIIMVAFVVYETRGTQPDLTLFISNHY